LPVPGRVAGRGAVIPVHLRCTDKGVVPADPLVSAGAASVMEGPREPPARPRSPRALPCQVSPVAIKIGDDAVAAPFAFFVIEVYVGPAGTLHTGAMKQGVFTLVVKESTGVLPDPVRMTLLDLLRLADGEPTKLAGHFPVLGFRPAAKDKPGTAAKYSIRLLLFTRSSCLEKFQGCILCGLISRQCRMLAVPVGGGLVGITGPHQPSAAVARRWHGRSAAPASVQS